eukprot:TRINITY_DN18611_c0_g1_i1.p1 TRINITY_DN18611_c0_g1~~TRINITY_DN18611_c0_g1_i1.p1  ORF type:complete len:280 (-),score=34.39 TRINITY_DN18611_c0_g1_i1:16-855(-)
MTITNKRTTSPTPAENNSPRNNNNKEEGRDMTNSITLSFPSRFFPLAAFITFVSTVAFCITSSRILQHDIGGIWWPYLSDTGKYPPESAIFGFGMTLTSVWICIVVILNYGKVKRDLERRGDLNRSRIGKRRNRLALICGLVSAPFLGLLAVFDTERSPELHLYFVLVFFPAIITYCFVNTSVYSFLAKIHRNNSALKKSVIAKRWCCYALLFFTTLYLPVGLSLVSDWYNYQNDVVVHTFRAVTQHLSVLCLVFYLSSFWFDFGVLRMTVTQTEFDGE